MARKVHATEIVEDWQAGLGSEDFLRGLVERVVQQVLEAEMTNFLGAGVYERSGERRGWRNGYKPRTLKTRVGELDTRITATVILLGFMSLNTNHNRALPPPFKS